MEYPFKDQASFLSWCKKAYPELELMKRGSSNGPFWFGGTPGLSQVEIHRTCVNFHVMSVKLTYRECKRVIGCCRILWGSPKA